MTRLRTSLLVARALVAASAAVLIGACSSGCLSLFAPSADLLDDPIVAELREDPGDDAKRFDHVQWGELVEEHVDYQAARVDYAGLQEDRAKLDAYLEDIANADLTALGDDEELALLINAYNAYTVALILEHFPDIDSIKDIDAPWKTRRYIVGGHKLSLDDIEHGLIRPMYKDSRIHFAVNCAAKGCPPLADAPFEGDKIDDQLDRAARRTLSDKRWARIEDGELRLTNVMNWYRKDFVEDDFEPHANTLALYAARYADKDVREFVEAHDGDPPLGFIDYDWSLNDVEE